jgi:hypothetical protein
MYLLMPELQYMASEHGIRIHVCMLLPACLASFLQVSGTSEQVVNAVRMITEKLRTVLGMGGGDRDRGGERGMMDRQGDNKRPRGPEPDDRRRGGPGGCQMFYLSC